MRKREPAFRSFFYMEMEKIWNTPRGEAPFTIRQFAEDLHKFMDEHRPINNGTDVENPLYREDAVPSFKEKLTPWLENATILAALDVSTLILVSTSDKIYSASEYFDLVWERGDLWH